MKKVTNNSKETIAFGKEFAKALKGGEVVLLVGDLGAGKTTFSKGVAAGLGVKRTVNSPTFVLMKVYDVKGKGKINNFVHIDTYRGLDIFDLENIGALEYFSRKDCVSFVEWGENVEKYLIKSKIKFKKIIIRNLDENARSFEIK
jgi:tRNA threonylcarbamoyladenosine biosynthesis protein TsaE